MAEEASFKSKVFKGFLWLGSGTFIGQSITWVSTIVVMRLLLPSDYGLMAMALTFIMLLTSISELGIGASIIQADKISEKEIGQVYGFFILSTIAGFGISFLIAPLIASFYNEPKLIILVRFLSLNFILISFYAIPQSLFIREMDFKTKAKVDIISQVLTAILTLVLAFNGMGVWALVVAAIALHFFKAVGYNIVRSSLVRPVFRFKGAEKLIKYGFTVTGDRLLYYLFTQSDKIIVGKLLGEKLLGIYAVALNLASIPMEKVLPIITQVSFTSYSRIQNDLDRIGRNLLRATRTIAFAGFPLFWGMASVAPEAITLILGAKWSALTVPFQLLCLVLPLRALGPILPPAVFAIGKPRVNLVNMAITSVFMSIAFFIGVQYGLKGVCVAWIIAYPIIFAVTSNRCLKVLGMSLRDVIVEIRFPFFASLVMVSLLFMLRKFIELQPLYTLIILILCAVTFYAGLLLIFKREEYAKLKGLLAK